MVVFVVVGLGGIGNVVSWWVRLVQLAVLSWLNGC